MDKPKQPPPEMTKRLAEQMHKTPDGYHAGCLAAARLGQWGDVCNECFTHADFERPDAWSEREFLSELATTGRKPTW